MKKIWTNIAVFIESFILLRNQKLMVKLCVFSSILVILPVFSVGFITYMYSSTELEEEFKQSSKQIIEQVELHIEYYLRDFEIASLKIINSPELGNILRQEPLSNEVNPSQIETALNVLRQTEYSRNDISNITVTLDSGIIFDSLRDQNYYPATNIKEEYWYSSVPQNGMIMLVSRTLKLKDKELPVISLVRRLYNPHTLKSVGMLVMDINFKRIEEISKMVTLDKNGYFFILDSKGHYVYHPDYSKLGNKTKFNELANLESESSGSLLIDNNQQEFVSYTLSPNLGWRFFTAAPYEDLRAGIKQIQMVIIWTIVISLIIAYLLGFGFSKSLVRPIHRLRTFMKEVEIGNLNGRVNVESRDEIGQLTAGFNNTVEKLSNLLEEVYISKLKETEMSLNKKEAELKMLQSQINPHFLYNSLETIRGMALEEGRENIASISSSLGMLLRYNLRNSSPTVSLREEMKFCDKYLQIQKFRFEERFEYQFELHESVLDMKVPKFSLQPIVENCFVHSYGENREKIKITISAQLQSESSLIIRITDTGLGMTEEVLNELTERLSRNSTSLSGSTNRDYECPSENTLLVWHKLWNNN